MHGIDIAILSICKFRLAWWRADFFPVAASRQGAGWRRRRNSAAEGSIQRRMSGQPMTVQGETLAFFNGLFSFPVLQSSSSTP